MLMDEDLLSVQPITSWLFISEFSLWISLSVFNTFITTFWFKCGLTGISTASSRSRTYMTISIIASTLYSYAFFIFLTCRYFDVITLQQMEDSCRIWLILPVPWAINRTFLYLYFLWRVHLVFRTSKLRMNKKSITALSATVCIMFILSWLFMYAFGEFIGCQESTHGLLSTLPFAITDSSFACLCLWLFVSRLRKTNKLKDKELTYVTQKFTILQVVTVSFTIGVNLIFLMVPVLAIVGIDATVNAICLILSVKAHDRYYRGMCVLCRYCCERVTIEENNIELSVEKTKTHTTSTEISSKASSDLANSANTTAGHRNDTMSVDINSNGVDSAKIQE